MNPVTQLHLPRTAFAGRRHAFTLIELLAVIAIIGVLAAMILPIAGSVSRVKKINTAQAELQGIETDLDNYKAKYGTYPPSNPKSSLINPLFYELSGATNNNNVSFQPLDGSSFVSMGDFAGMFNVGGVVNCSKGSGEDAVYAKDFLTGIKANEIASTTNANGSTFFYLVTSVGGPDANYQPLEPSLASSANPFRYAYPGTNNPSSYDLWIQLSINSTKYLICNWSQQTIRNSPLP